MKEILQMSHSERLQTMEQLWESFASDGLVPQPPDWHGKTLAEREAKIISGQAKWLTLNDLEKRLLNR